ncbi:MAG: cobalamin-dependent protein [Candidatus Bathyarchaeia archaeon]|jgi:trimethylamine corrinoid protein
MSVNDIIKEYKTAFYAYDDKKCGELALQAVEVGMDPLDIVEKNLLVWTRDLTGKSFYAGMYEEKAATMKSEEAIMVSDIIMIAECLTASVSVLRPYLAKSARKVASPGTIIIGTVEGDVHDIGKTIVGSILGSAGFNVTDIGFDKSSKDFAMAAKLNKADILAVSCSMALARPVMTSILDDLKKFGIREKTKVIVGGQATYVDDPGRIGVDAHGADVSEALSKTEELVRVLKEQKK